MTSRTDTIKLVYRLIEGSPTKQIWSIEVDDITADLKEFRRLDVEGRREVLTAVVQLLNNQGTSCHLTDNEVVFLQDEVEPPESLVNDSPYYPKPSPRPRGPLNEVPILPDEVVPDF